MKSKLKVLRLRGIDIFEQLRLEELLFRKDAQNWFIFNTNNPIPKIVLGFSGKVGELVDIDKTRRDSIPLVRRYTGGGTVIVDDRTLFGTFIMNQKDVDIPPYPRDIMKWSTGMYDPVFGHTGEFGLREHDYTIGNMKIAGNAQAIIKNRWCHHTSFLWDYDPCLMKYLLMPKNRPEYRADREHSSFLTRIKYFLPSVNDLEERLQTSLRSNFDIEEVKIDINAVNAEEMAAALGFDVEELGGKTIRTKYLTETDLAEAEARKRAE
jgi:lipoate-protein ligase A